MKETDFKKLAIQTPFVSSDIQAAYNVLRGVGVSDEILETLLPTLIKTAIDNDLALAYVVDQFCNAGKSIEPQPVTQTFNLPERVIFFCDCNAKFGSAESLKAHSADCPKVRPIVAGGHYPTRDGIIMLAELTMKNFFAVMPEASDLALFLVQITKIEFLRRQGKAPTDGKSMYDFLTGPDTPYTRAQGIELIELMEEVSGWYGIGREEIAQLTK